MDISTALSIVTLIFVLILCFAIVYSIKLSDIFFKITNKNIRESIKTEHLTLSPSSESVIDLAIDIWRLEKKLGKESEKLTDEQNKKFDNSVSRIKRYLDKNDISIVDYTDKKYNDGLNVDIIGMEKDSSISESIIKETHEPAILLKGQLIRKAKVIILEK